MVKDKFSFGVTPRMREVPPGQHAELKFSGKMETVDTEWGEKYSFPIVLISHDSYDSLPINCEWESKSMVGKEVYNAYNNKDLKDFRNAYKSSKWQLTRFDTGQYFLDQL